MSEELLHFGNLEKSPHEQIQFSLKRYYGHDYLDIRVYWYHPQEKKWFPSIKGVTVSLKMVPFLAEIVNNAAAKIFDH